MKVLGIDFETQSLEPQTRVTEVGAILYEKNFGDIEFKKIGHVSALCYEPDYPPQTEAIVELTGITDHMLKESGETREFVFKNRLLPLVDLADVVIAHNANFDKRIFVDTCKHLGLQIPEKEWICTLTNFPWPKSITCHKLSHIAYEHSILVDPKTLHRAINDVALMMQVVACYDFESVLAYAREPWMYLHAQPLGPWLDSGVQTGIAKSHGFTWETVRGTDHKWPKKWVTRVKVSRMDDVMRSIEKSASPFPVLRIQGI